MKLKKFLLIFIPFLVFSKAQDYSFVGSIQCGKGAEYSILVNTDIRQGTKKQIEYLYSIINDINRDFLLVQTKGGECSLKDTLTIELKQPLPAVALLKFLADIYNFQYIINGNLKYKPSYLIFYRKGITLEDTITYLASEIEKNNKSINVEYIPEKRIILISDRYSTISLQKNNRTKACESVQLKNYVDLCKKEYCQRYSLILQGSEVNLQPYFICKNGKKNLYTYKNKCPKKTYVGYLYIDSASLLDVLKIFEKIFNIHFLYEPEEIVKVKGAKNVHLSLSCLTLKNVLDFLQRNFHLYIQKLSINSYRIYTDKNAYSLVLQKVSNNITKIFYLKNIQVKDFVKLLTLYFGDRVIFSADPTFNAVTVIAPPTVIKEVEKKLGIYIKKDNNFDNLMTKVFYIKYGSPKKIQQEVKEYLSNKGTIKYISKARALEITDYPTNIAMIERVFGRFLSQNPIKIKISVKFVSINKSFAKSLGFNWAFVYTGTPVNVGNQVYTGFTFGGSGSKSLLSMTGESYLQGTNSTMFLALQFAYKKFNPISLQLSALESINMAKTLDNPTLILLNNQNATITRGIQIPYQASAENGGTTVEFATANINLTVQPILLPDGRILLNLQLAKDEPGVFVAGQAPPINTFRIKDSLIVPDGSTVVIGGVIKRSNNKGENGVPFLRTIPLLGWLFKNVSYQKTDEELLVFITAKVISE